MNLRTPRLLAAALTLLAATPALAGFDRVGPTDTSFGYPTWYQDTTGVTMDLCSPLNQAELDGGWCLLLTGDTTAPEVFPTSFFGEHFYWAADSNGTMVGGGKARLVLALEGAFSTGAVIPGNQIAFGRFRLDIRNVPLAGTYTIYTPYGIRTFTNVAAGARIFSTEDIGINCPVGDFSCALQAVVGPFLLASDTPGGAELAPIAGPVPGKLYVADPARIGPVTGSPVGTFATSSGVLDANRFRIEGPGGVVVFDSTDFTLMGRLHTAALPGRVTLDRSSYSRSANGDVKLGVFATGEPSMAPRLPAGPISPKVQPQLEFFKTACAGTPGQNGQVLPPFSAPNGPSIPLDRFGNTYLGTDQPAAMPTGVCVVDKNARDANNAVVPQYFNGPVADLVSISEAFYDPFGGGTLFVAASSSDTLGAPALSLGSFGDLITNQPLAAGQVTLTPIAAVPSKVRVLSAAGGATELQVTVGRKPATGVTLTSSLPSPQLPGTTVTFTAHGQGSTGYEYRFWLNTLGTWAVVRDWNAGATWTLGNSTPEGDYQVAVEVRTTTTVVRDAVSDYMPYTLRVPAASGVLLSTAAASPHPAGSAVVFQATGLGSTGYSYRFWLNAAGVWAVVQDWSALDTWTMPANQAPGGYFVAVEVRTAAYVPRDAVSATLPFDVFVAQATSVTLSTTTTFPASIGTSVTFLATGQGSTGYSYRFWLNTAGVWAVVQDWSAADTYTLLNAAGGTYQVAAEVRTAPAGARDAISDYFTFVVGNPPATSVGLTPSLPSPHATGTAVDFKAVGQGSTGYSYRFWVNSGAAWVVVQDWSATDTWQLPAASAPGIYTVAVEVRTSANGAPEAASPWITYQVTP